MREQGSPGRSDEAASETGSSSDFESYPIYERLIRRTAKTLG